ncbi:MAG: ribosome-associated translation inhibitor RaiA [Phycisphaerales bacterium]|nr:ribosome-associated translation inhibitor RaiA [Phycisphaerales bacterium]
MVVTISGRHLEITPALRQHAQERAEKLPKYYDLINAVEIVLEASSGKQNRAEIIVSAEHRDTFVAHHDGDDLYGCIDQAFHKIQQQIVEHKKRFRNRKHSGE